MLVRQLAEVRRELSGIGGGAGSPQALPQPSLLPPPEAFPKPSPQLSQHVCIREQLHQHTNEPVGVSQDGWRHEQHVDQWTDHLQGTLFAGDTQLAWDIWGHLRARVSQFKVYSRRQQESRAFLIQCTTCQASVHGEYGKWMTPDMLADTKQKLLNFFWSAEEVKAKLARQPVV